MSADDLIENLRGLQIGAKKTQVVRTKDYLFKPNTNQTYKITSYNVKEQAYKSGELPVMARGLFTRFHNNTHQICVRGYDKFFNIGETRESTWPFLKQNTKGPYEMTLKENGCIIFVSTCDGHLLVTSKHALGKVPDRVTHAEKGEEWIHTHLKRVGKSVTELVSFLEKEQLTAVFELADDEFEEHILAYPKDKAGLYLHGLNENKAEFYSRPFDQVESFGKEFGFWIVKMFQLDTIEAVQQFSGECAKTGSYEGIPIEGFVVRSRRTDTNRVHFFKIKFDEPYLMFREWREVTRVLLNGKRKPRFRFKLTEKYISWCVGQIRQNPQLFKYFNQNKGIIHVRNKFLVDELGVSNFSGIELPSFCESSGIDPNFGAEKCLIIPVATIGVGKTTLARTITNLYPDLIGHIQNDNIGQKRAAEAFEQGIMDLFQQLDIVIADRNNHLLQHRDGLSTVFRSEYPGGKIVALDWGVDYMDKRALLELTAKRVEERGENHQSLTPQRTKDYKRVLSGFIFHRDPIDIETDADSRINTILDLSIDGSVTQNVRTIINALSLDYKSDIEIEQAFLDAKSFKEPFKKEVKQKERKPKYYAVKITTSLFTLIEESIKNSEYGSEWEALLPAVKIGAQKGWHCTITVRSAETVLIKEFDERWQSFKAGQGSENDPFAINISVKLDVSRILWNAKVMTIEVESAQPDFPSLNTHRHITIATLDPDAKPVESNHLISDFYADKKVKQAPLQATIDGIISFYFY